MPLGIQRAGTERLGPADEKGFVYEESKKGLHNGMCLIVHKLRPGC